MAVGTATAYGPRWLLVALFPYASMLPSQSRTSRPSSLAEAMKRRPGTAVRMPLRHGLKLRLLFTDIFIENSSIRVLSRALKVALYKLQFCTDFIYVVFEEGICPACLITCNVAEKDYMDHVTIYDHMRPLTRDELGKSIFSQKPRNLVCGSHLTRKLGNVL